MMMLVFLIPPIAAATIVLIAIIFGNDEHRAILISILYLLWAVLLWPFKAAWERIHRPR